MNEATQEPQEGLPQNDILRILPPRLEMKDLPVNVQDNEEIQKLVHDLKGPQNTIGLTLTLVNEIGWDDELRATYDRNMRKFNDLKKQLEIKLSELAK